MLRSLLVLGCAGAAFAASGYAKFDLQRESVQSLRKRGVPNQGLGQIITLGSNQSVSRFLKCSLCAPADICIPAILAQPEYRNTAAALPSPTGHGELESFGPEFR
jgi:hypothetical protein